MVPGEKQDSIFESKVWRFVVGDIFNAIRELKRECLKNVVLKYMVDEVNLWFLKADYAVLCWVVMLS